MDLRLRSLATISIAFLAALSAWLTPLAQERPLPPLDPFLKQVRVRLQPDDVRNRAYVYTYTQRRMKLDGDARPVGESVKVAESYPGFGPGEPRWDRVLEEDGKPVPETELRRRDLERQKKAEAYLRRQQSEVERAKIAREREKELHDIEETLEDAFRVYDVDMVGREAVDGHETILLTFRPKPHAKAQTRQGRWLQALKGRMWVNEADYELVKLDVEAVEDISLAMGLLARLNKGTTLSFARRKVNGDEWLPSRAEYTLAARVLMLKRLRERVTFEFSNYRKFSVDTRTTITSPTSPD